jgi:antibiotic biosynthesis monooxygenase (ABM) superfamily enzyme
MPTLIVKRLVTLGHEKEYEKRMEHFIDNVENMDGYMGINIVRAEDKRRPLYIFSAKFDTKKNLQKFKESEIRKQYLRELQNISQAPIKERTINKLDWWFALPGNHYDLPPYKMLIVTILAVYPSVFILNLLFNPVQDIAVLAVRTFVVVGITIVIMSYITLPFLLNVFKSWLHPHTI